MKKYYAALAVLGGFAAAASAQSNITVYGIVDQGVAKVNTGQSYLGAVAVQPGEWVVKPATSNRVGFRGSEDLGDGLRANFVIEHRLFSDTGAAENPARFWQGSSWIGLSKANLGEMRLGRDYTPAFYSAFAGDPWNYDYNVAGFLFYTLAGNRAGTETIRAANQLSYKTPSFGGLTVMAAVSAREGATSETANNGRNAGFNVTYSSGPSTSAGSLLVSLGFNDVAGPTDDRIAVLTAAYNFGFIRPSLLISRADNRIAGTTTSVDADSWVLGATAPLGLGSLKVGYGEIDNPAAATAAFRVETKKFGLGYEYYLSKRTSLHTDFGIAKADDLKRTTGFEAGVRHTF